MWTLEVLTLYRDSFRTLPSLSVAGQALSFDIFDLRFTTSVSIGSAVGRIGWNCPDLMPTFWGSDTFVVYGDLFWRSGFKQQGTWKTIEQPAFQAASCRQGLSTKRGEKGYGYGAVPGADAWHDSRPMDLGPVESNQLFAWADGSSLSIWFGCKTQNLMNLDWPHWPPFFLKNFERFGKDLRNLHLPLLSLLHQRLRQKAPKHSPGAGEDTWPDI